LQIGIYFFLGRMHLGAPDYSVKSPKGQFQEMKKPTSRNPKKLVIIGVRVDDEFLSNLMCWILENEPTMTRPEAIRRLVEIGLKAKVK
jgi:hypothetical protein